MMEHDQVYKNALVRVLENNLRVLGLADKE